MFCMCFERGYVDTVESKLCSVRVCVLKKGALL